MLARTPRSRGPNNAGSRTVEKALQLLQAVAEQGQPLSLLALSRAAGIEKTATHRLASTLARHGLLHFDDDARTYSLGLRLADLGYRAIAQLSFPREARPHLEELGRLSGETVNLGVFDDGLVVFVDQVPSAQPIVIRARVGTRVPAHCTAAGKVLLALGPARWREQVLERGLARLTPNTITDPGQLNEALARVSSLGYAVDDEEHRQGVRCAGVPIRDHSGWAVASISISGPAFRLSRERLGELVEPLLETARALSSRLGYRDGETR